MCTTIKVIAGRATRLELGRGARRGSEPLDGGARRSIVLLQSDRDRGLDPSVLLAQLAASRLHFADDPERGTPQRVDPG